MSDMQYWQTRAVQWEKDYRDAMALAQQYKAEADRLRKQLKELNDAARSIHKNDLTTCDKA